MKRVLVTGATGFTGGHLARTLIRRGYQVQALVRRPAEAADLQQLGVDIVEGDLLSRPAIERAVAGASTVYHIAALYRSARHNDQHYWDVNVGGTEKLLEAARTAGVERFVHCSTIGVHGSVTAIPSDEDAPYSPGDIYQKTKLEGEMLARRHFASGLPGVVVRPAGIYGPGDTRFLKLFRMVGQRRFIMFGSGEAYCHLVYIDDLVEGILRCGELPQAVGGVYILAGNSYVTLNELVREIARVLQVAPPRLRCPMWPLLTAAAACERICQPLGIEPPLHTRRAEFFLKNRAFSIARARHEIGYEPRVSLAQGLQRTASWYQRQGLLPVRTTSRSFVSQSSSSSGETDDHNVAVPAGRIKASLSQEASRNA